MSARRGFTLFEVAISLLVMAIAVLSALLFFPAGIKAQEQARFRAYAAVKAMEIIDRTVNTRRTLYRHRAEDRRIWNTVVNHAYYRPDLENELTHPQSGRPLIPLPEALARRIDSDDDEIKRVLDLGGTLFVSNITAAQKTTDTETQLPNEAQKLVFAFVGFPQQNALIHHPVLAWPYYDWYPSPPVVGAYPTSAGSWEEALWSVNGWPGHAEYLELCAHLAQPTGIRALTQAEVLVYLQLAQALWTATGGTFDPLLVDPDAPEAAPPAQPQPYHVNALRYLAHAAVWLTGKGMTPTADQEAQAARAHEIALRWAMAYAAASPYDWGAPRPLNRPLMVDLPLLQHDLFPSSAFPAIAPGDPGGPSRTLLGERWRIVAPTPTGRPMNTGLGSLSPTDPLKRNRDVAHLAATWGDPEHQTLHARFDPSERCRQLVVWAVDWQSWEDSEEQPSLPPDSSLCTYDPYGLGWKPDWGDGSAEPRVWTSAARTATTDNTTTSADLMRGRWGADRNGNGRFDRGPLPASVRLRAVTIARFNVYDKRAIAFYRY